MEIHITNIIKIDIFTTIFQNLMVFSDFVNLQIDINGFHIQGMDNSHVSIYELSIPAAWFNNFIVPKTAIILGINTVIFSKILSSREKTQEIKFLYDSDKNNDRLTIFMGEFINNNTTTTTSPTINAIQSNTSAAFDRSFEMPLVDIETDIISIPKFEYEAEMTICAAKLAAVVQQLKMFNDTMTIICNEEKILMNSSDNSSAFMTVEIKIDEVSEYSIDEGQEVKLSYSLSYMSNICKFHKIAKEVQLCLTRDYPIKMTYDIGDGAQMKFYLAPKIGEEDT